jgi:hypothetical protein
VVFPHIAGSMDQKIWYAANPQLAEYGMCSPIHFALR